MDEKIKRSTCPNILTLDYSSISYTHAQLLWGGKKHLPTNTLALSDKNNTVEHPGPELNNEISPRTYQMSKKIAVFQMGYL